LLAATNTTTSTFKS